MAGLSVSEIASVDVIVTPVAAPTRSFGTCMIVGPSAVIDVRERMRLYSNFSSVAEDFGTSTPEYLAAQLYFQQVPVPRSLYIGRWAKTATAGMLYGGVLTAAEQAALIISLKAITDGSTTIPVDSVDRTVSSMNFAEITTLAGAATIIDTALTQGTVTWDAASARFIVTSGTTGATSAVGYAKSSGAGTQIHSLLKLDSANAAAPVNGIVAEDPDDATLILQGMSNSWYALMFADMSISDAQHLAVAAQLASAAPARIYGVTYSSAQAYDPLITTDLGAVLKAQGNRRTCILFSSTTNYAVASLLGRMLTVDFTANNTVITLMHKQAPGVTPESLTTTQAATLKSKNYNVLATYTNDKAIIQHGVMTNGEFIDEVHGLDWLADDIQTSLWNALYTSPSKVPQTDAGMNQLLTVAEESCIRGVNNGLIGAGLAWNGPNIGAILTGQTLAKGYYIYMAPISSQSPADRAARKAPAMQLAVNLAGAVHSVSAIVYVNR